MKHLYILWVVVILLAGASVLSLIRVQEDQASVHKILCTSKIDDQKELRQSIKFLREHPNGSADFSRAFIISAIQQDRLKAQTLSGLSCG